VSTSPARTVDFLSARLMPIFARPDCWLSSFLATSTAPDPDPELAASPPSAGFGSSRS